MSEPHYTPEELEEFTKINHLMQLRRIEVGKVIDKKMYDAISFFMEGALEKIKALKETVTTIHFDKNGQAHSTDNDGMIASVNGVSVVEPPAGAE